MHHRRLPSLPGSRETLSFSLLEEERGEKERIGSRSAAIDRNWHVSIYLFLARICLHRHATLLD